MTGENSNYERMTEESSDNQQSNGDPAQIQMRQRCASPRERHKGKLYGLGIAECVLGGLTIILGIAVNAVAARRYNQYHCYYVEPFSFSSQGIWIGILLITTGILGVKTRKKPSVGIFQANMALSVISSVFAAMGVVLSGIASTNLHMFEEVFVIHFVIVILLLFGMIICITHSAFCCAGVCCSNTRTSNTVVYIPQHTTATQQFVQLPNGQLAAIVGDAATSQLCPMIDGIQPSVVSTPQNQVFQPLLSNQIVMNTCSGNSKNQVFDANSSTGTAFPANFPSSSGNSGNREPIGYLAMPK